MYELTLKTPNGKAVVTGTSEVDLLNGIVQMLTAIENGQTCGVGASSLCELMRGLGVV